MFVSWREMLGTVMAAAVATPWSNRFAKKFPSRTFPRMPRGAFLLAALALVAWASCCRAGEPSYSPGHGLLTWLDWREPDDLPRRFRNHCGFSNGRYYCAYHCGSGYQFFYCSRVSFGCCHIGDGYCDYRGFLRCRP
jgi:hypothetical protein